MREDHAVGVFGVAVAAEATLTLAQRVYIINNGLIVHEGAAEEIKAQPHLLQRYLGL